METTALRLQISDSAISVSHLEKFAEGWFMAGEIDQHSERTLSNRRMMVKNLLWFLRRRSFTECGLDELRQFFVYVTNGHKEPGGRWGNPQMTKKVTTRTVKDYHGHLRTLFRWLVAEGKIASSPMDRIKVPTDRPDEIQPFSDSQVQALLAAAKQTQLPRRDQAILWTLLDTGLRASELCQIRFEDCDLKLRKITVEGKGGKSRPVYVGKTTAKALFDYMNEDGREKGEPLFVSARGEALSRYGLRQLLERLGVSASLTSARCSPHTFRHTFAISFLKNGGNQFALMRLLGHTNIQMTARYVRLAQADVENQHRQYSPSDALKGRKK